MPHQAAWDAGLGSGGGNRREKATHLENYVHRSLLARWELATLGGPFQGMKGETMKRKIKTRQVYQCGSCGVKIAGVVACNGNVYPDDRRPIEAKLLLPGLCWSCAQEQMPRTSAPPRSEE